MQPRRVMTSEELAEALAERERVEAKIEKFRLAALDDVIQDVRKTIELYKLTPTDLFPDVKVVPRNTSRRASARPVRYRNEKGQTWGGGVGPRPRWIKEALARGEDIEKYAVT